MATATDVKEDLEGCLDALKRQDASGCCEELFECCKTICLCQPVGAAAGGPDMAECDRLCGEIQAECHRASSPKAAAAVGAISPAQWALILEGVQFMVGLFQRWKTA